MDKIPFTFYDWFGYLASGGVLCLGSAFALGIESPLTTSNSAGIWSSAVWLVVIYVVGHLNSHIAFSVLEHGFVKRLLGMPEERLLSQDGPPWWGLLLRDYSRPLDPAELRGLQLKDEDGNIDNPKSLFRLAFARVKSFPSTKSRLDIFNVLYGFHRNMCFAVFLVWLEMMIWNQPSFFLAYPVYTHTH